MVSKQIPMYVEDNLELSLTRQRNFLIHKAKKQCISPNIDARETNFRMT